MFELADHLVGIYKTNNCTKSVTISPGDFVVAAHEGGDTAASARAARSPLQPRQALTAS